MHDVQVSFVKGEVVTGTVVQFEPAGALVDIGAKATAYMPAREVRTENAASHRAVLAPVSSARRFAPRAASAARCSRSQGRPEKNANEADRKVHDCRCKVSICKCQELHAPG